MALPKTVRNEIPSGQLWSECAKKKRYKDEAEVEKVIRRRHEQGSIHLRYYDCRFCDGFHITKRGSDE